MKFFWGLWNFHFGCPMFFFFGRGTLWCLWGILSFRLIQSQVWHGSCVTSFYVRLSWFMPSVVRWWTPIECLGLSIGCFAWTLLHLKVQKKLARVQRQQAFQVIRYQRDATLPDSKNKLLQFLNIFGWAYHYSKALRFFLTVYILFPNKTRGDFAKIIACSYA